MKFLVKFQMQVEKANSAIKDRNFVEKMQQLMDELNPESVYFSINGERGGYMVVNFDDPSQMIKTAGPLFFWLDATVEFIPVMTLEDIKKGASFIRDAADKYGD